jgi:large subunit ribosomal protein L22
MEAQAIHRYIGSSPRKMRLVIDLIRGKAVDEALHILHFSPKHASKVAEKVLRSAIANLQNKESGGRLEPNEIMVKTVFVDCGMVMKRISPAPMGRAFRIRKRSNHLTIVVTPMEAKKTAKAAPAKKAAAKNAPAKKEAKTKKESSATTDAAKATA